MNELFAVQQRLMAMRAGPAWEWAYTDEEDDPADPGVPHATVEAPQKNGLARGRGSQGR
jgi:hypothetical protein